MDTTYIDLSNTKQSWIMGKILPIGTYLQGNATWNLIAVTIFNNVNKLICLILNMAFFYNFNLLKEKRTWKRRKETNMTNTDVNKQVND